MTIRVRLALLYGALFLAAGAVLLAGTYVLATRLTWPVLPEISFGEPPLDPVRQRAAEVRGFVTAAAVGLGAMTVASVGLGWVMAGRALRPLRAMTAAAREISARNLHQRLGAQGPADEIKDLADTFDALLERVEAAFEAQRRFVANASHELRTPLTFERTLLEVALAEPGADAERLRGVCGRALEANRQQERLIEALLTLARSQRGLDHREPLDLASITAGILNAAEWAAQDTSAEGFLLEGPGGGQPGLGLSSSPGGESPLGFYSSPGRRSLFGLSSPAGGRPEFGLSSPGGRPTLARSRLLEPAVPEPGEEAPGDGADEPVEIRVEAELRRAPAFGDPRLVERLVANLVDNAGRHNLPGGWIRVWTGLHDGRPTVRVTNSGPVVPPARVDSLFQPFLRMEATRTSDDGGLGLGLSIVAAIATAHDADLHATALPLGGLDVRVAFWAVPDFVGAVP
ncbi:sensor histidine kinase [Nonomuraea dietziae]|uniref:sensor histidine kinase n=1 Tax=Nonomuraea dietziae TaxID=65515 RepID=UPI0033E53E5B